jgi:hypothetical protein
MEREHPATEEHDWPIPDEADISMGRPKESLRKADPLVGVGPRGMHSEHLKVLVTGRMICAESPAAFELFANLGSAFLGAQIPPWLRCRLGARCLTALCKKAMVSREVPDARPVKAEDFDCSA